MGTFPLLYHWKWEGINKTGLPPQMLMVSNFPRLFRSIFFVGFESLAAGKR